VLLVQHWPETGERLRDTDDAMRLVGIEAVAFAIKFFPR
jgi:hypothetical protein